jgi:8-oxo-dGTP diphosphatase
MTEILPELRVAAGLLIDPEGRVLLAQRPAGRDDAGLWEFPGGKLEERESAFAALKRELVEELGIDIAPGRPLIRVPQRQPKRLLWLEAILVEDWRGEPRGLEGQTLRWMLPEDVEPAALPAADRPILACLRQPAQYWISPETVAEPAVLAAWFRAAAAAGAERLQLRVPALGGPARAALARHAAEYARKQGIQLLLNARGTEDLELAGALGCGAQISRTLLMRLDQRPALACVGASCHDPVSLRRAESLGCDFALLSPVLPTLTHPDAPPLGWSGFSLLRACTSLPVYALGGVGPGDLADARAAGAQGVAGIRGFFAGDAV